MIDLEDGVAPGDKDDARETALRFLLDTLSDPVEVCVRINDPASEVGRRDINALAGVTDRIRMLVVPKSTSATVRAVQHQIDSPLLALVETALGVEEATAIAAQGAVAGILFGNLDYTTDVSAHGGWHLTELSWVKSRLVNAAAAAGKWALAGPRPSLDDPDGLAAEVRSDRSLGFVGKLCIHPAQIATVNDGFAPSAEQMTWARHVLDSRDANDIGAARVDGQMIDRPVIERARLILASLREQSP
jgi:citrate lyase beta subunit